MILAEGVRRAALAQIRRSRLVIADYTQASGTVEFMVGIAVGSGIPVIGSCRSDGVDRLYPIDIRRHDLLIWKTPEELSEKLTQRILAVLGRSTTEPEDGADEVAGAVLPDSINAALRKLVDRGRERGYVTYDELNSAIPVEQVTAEFIEDVMSMLQALNIEIVEKGVDDADI